MLKVKPLLLGRSEGGNEEQVPVFVSSKSPDHQESDSMCKEMNKR